MNRVTRPLAAAVVALLLVSGCSTGEGEQSGATGSGQTSASASGTVLDRLGLQGKDAVATIDALDRSTEERPLDVKASVKADQLVLTDQAGERSLPIPADKFYLSIAPYEKTTHECFAHSLSGCQGEQVGQKLHVTITDQAGKALVDTDTATWSNGFVGFWLPRDIRGTVSVTMDGKKGTVPFATTADSPTCLTTLQVR